MKFVTNIDAKKFNDFVSTHPKNHFLQTYEWGVFKSKSPEWSFETVGLENDQGELVAAALVLIRFLPIIKRPFLYIPRGFVLDFNNEQQLKDFTEGMKNFAKS
ncbi:peptidoglycan bridge formation glycyltransferase FemA/FemB family protein, partial [Turicibacter sanguinis]|nr:peptidoglycan bridge formation glycyltransferase FemA/FemB family protein [Turicibacter sanguinis]